MGIQTMRLAWAFRDEGGWQIDADLRGVSAKYHQALSDEVWHATQRVTDGADLVRVDFGKALAAVAVRVLRAWSLADIEGGVGDVLAVHLSRRGAPMTREMRRWLRTLPESERRTAMIDSQSCANTGTARMGESFRGERMFELLPRRGVSLGAVTS